MIRGAERGSERKQPGVMNGNRTAIWWYVGLLREYGNGDGDEREAGGSVNMCP